MLCYTDFTVYYGDPGCSLFLPTGFYTLNRSGLRAHTGWRGVFCTGRAISGTPLSQDGRTGRQCNSHPHFGSLTDGALERCFRMSDWRLLPCPQTKRPFANRKVGPEVYGIWIPSIPLMTTDFVFFAFKNENSDSGNGGASTQSRGFTFRPSVDWQVHTESPRPPRR